MPAFGRNVPEIQRLSPVIRRLINEKYVERLGRELKPTWKAFRLMFALKHFGVAEITSPYRPADWYPEDHPPMPPIVARNAPAYQIIGVAPRELEAFDARVKFVAPLSWPPAAENPQGRYGVVAGERRTTIWAYALDIPGTQPG